MTEPDWLDPDLGFGHEALPYCVFSLADHPPRIGVGVGEGVLDVAPLLEDETFAQDSLNDFMARGPSTWHEVRSRLAEVLHQPGARDRVGAHLHPRTRVQLRMPLRVGDFVDFYSSLEHATNLGKILRPHAPSLPPAWRHLPIGYHGRAGTVVVSGTSIGRPRGLRLVGGVPRYGPSLRLDFEAEVGFVVGVGSSLGEPISTASFAEHVFGVVLVNDWSARDIQSFEYVPLGPFLGKAFATSMSAWVVPLEALAAARCPGPQQDPPPAAHLRSQQNWGLNLQLKVELCGTVVSQPDFSTMYWTADQQLAHLTSGGAMVRTGDLFASGTVSGPGRQFGSMIELSDNGNSPVSCGPGMTRGFLEDGDSVTISGTALAGHATQLRLGSVSGTVRGATSSNEKRD